MKTSLKRLDYHKYPWKRGEFTRAVCFCAAIVGVLAYFFYRSALAMLPLSVIGVLLFRSISRRKAEKLREELAAQFRECILAVSSSLQAGYSVENAFLECRLDMVSMYGENSLICRELNFIRSGLNINITLEELLLDMAHRSGSEDIEQFGQIFALAKRNGGNMAEIIRGAAGRIEKRIEMQQETKLLLSGKRMELTIMKGIPFGILFYIDLGNPGYFDLLYHNLTGVVVMTGCLAVYLGAYVLGEKIMTGIMAEQV